jgi:23S rRNA (cytosine1962-C5)-methyltransferase
MDNVLTTEKTEDYELLDSGGGEKLERYGKVVLSRPDPQVLWSKTLNKEEWGKADAVFTHTSLSGKWSIKKEFERPWSVSLDGLVFSLDLLPSKHLGLFPEQLGEWKWLESKIKNEVDSGRSVSVLNLFGYTGGATLACARAGASVCHVDASSFAVDLAAQNQKSSDLQDRKIRFIVDDVRKFVEREIKRGNKYNVILMDPPVYGKGTKKEVWKIEDDLMPLLSRVKEILVSDPLSIVINGYASIYSHITYGRMLSAITSNLSGKVSSGEFSIKESASGKILPAGIWARYDLPVGRQGN